VRHHTSIDGAGRRGTTPRRSGKADLVSGLGAAAKAQLTADVTERVDQVRQGHGDPGAAPSSTASATPGTTS
jgi:hypothetical protein